MKVALLGLSHPHSGILLTTLANLPVVTSIVLWNDDPSEAAKPLFPASAKIEMITTELDRVLADPELSVVVVSVRHDQAAPISRRAAKAGKHLIVEKPAGLTSREIRELRDECRRAGIVASVLYPRRFHPCMRAARELVRTNAIGSILTLETRFLTTQVKFRDPASWLFRRAQSGGGILLWLGSHCLDLLHFLTGDEVAEVGAFLANRSGAAIEVEDTAALILKFRSGAIGSLHAGYTLAHSGAGYLNATGYDSYLAVNGSAGRIIWPDLNPRLQIESGTGPNPGALHDKTFPMPASPAYGGFAGEEFFRCFFAAVEGHGTPPTTLDDALRTALIVEAAAEASATGRTVRIAPDPFPR